MFFVHPAQHDFEGVFFCPTMTKSRRSGLSDTWVSVKSWPTKRVIDTSPESKIHDINFDAGSTKKILG